MKIAVYCSSKSAISPHFIEATRELGEWMGREGHTLVYGGSAMGLMEVVAKAVHENGGQVIGVVPQVLEKAGKSSDFIDVFIPCDNLSDRKDLMLLHADVAVALPGGIGTLDEIFSMAAAHTLGYHKKKVILYNVNGFWQPLVELLDSLRDQGFVSGDYHKRIDVANNFEELKRLLS